MSSKPDSWIGVTEDTLDAFGNGTWPFTKITKQQFVDELGWMSDRGLMPRTLRIIGAVICTLGIIFTSLSIGTFWRKAFVEKNNFFKSMMVIAVLDLMFNISDLCLNAGFRTFKLTGSTDPIGMWILMFLRAFAYTISLASDIFALVLTFERYLAIVKPHAHVILTVEKRMIFLTVSAIIVTVLSMTRMHYMLENTVIPKGDKYVYMDTDSWVANLELDLATFSDIALPFILSIIMLTLSTLFLVAVVKRRRNKMKQKNQIYPTTQHTLRTVSHGIIGNQLTPDGNTHTTNTSIMYGGQQNIKKQSQDENSIVVLTLTLDALFLLNQLGYCMYTIYSWVIAQYPLFFESDLDYIHSRRVSEIMSRGVTVVSVVSECLSHAINFPIYVALSKSIRQEFLMFVKTFTK